MSGSPFSLLDDDAYGRWRDAKLAHYPKSIKELTVDIGDLSQPTDVEIKAVHQCLQKAGLAIYKSADVQDIDSVKDQIKAWGQHFGLRHLDQNPYADDDGMTPIHVAETSGRKQYIPYTNRAINWHTDGYYNAPDRAIRAMILHCVRPAMAGGENMFLDPEIVYVLMRDADPDLIHALSQDDVLTIPGNEVDDVVDRGDAVGPVFSVNDPADVLHMRYTARKHNVQWSPRSLVTRAVAFLENLLQGENGAKPFIFTHRLTAGEGVICKNCLHTRSAFDDNSDTEQNRMLLRGRYFDLVKELT